MKIPVLFCRSDSIYKTFPEADVYDLGRNALEWEGGVPAIYHPPCRTWSSLRHCTKAPQSERQLALWAIKAVRTWGGILEHPRTSSLWNHVGAPKPGFRDQYGGFLLDVDQFWWGHRAQKRTYLYFVGFKPRDLIPYPIQLGQAPRVFTNNQKQPLGHPLHRPEITEKERDSTPPKLARWLLDNALFLAKTKSKLAIDSKPL